MNFRTIAMREWTHWIGLNRADCYIKAVEESSWWSIFPEFKQFADKTDDAYIRRTYPMIWRYQRYGY